MSKDQMQENNNGILESWVKFATAAIKEIGFIEFMVLLGSFFIWIFSSDAQKTAIIDKYVLFEGVTNNPIPFSLIVMTLILVIIIQYVYYKKMTKINKEEVKRVSQEKRDLHQVLLNKSLSSSDKKEF